MRIRRLDLLAYGHFTDAGFDLPARLPDIHLVYGPNEAGKSTALSAVEDLLFGIPHNTRHGFLHSYASMRLGAMVEGEHGDLNFRRRKGTKDTLLDNTGVPLAAGDAALAPFLHGAERAFYARMFCLDHERLRRGGQEILDAQDDVGQILFSAGAGVAGLREHLKRLQSDADSLWGKKRAGHRKYFQAEDRLKSAEGSLREHTVATSRWHELSVTLGKANDAYEALENEIETMSADARKLARVRRVYRDVLKHVEIVKRIDELSEIRVLSETADQTLRGALDLQGRSQIRLDGLNEQVESLREEKSELTCDEAILARNDDIGRLHDLRIKVRDGKSDLPKRQAELAVAEGELERFAEELGWRNETSEVIVAQLPTRATIAGARGLAKQHGQLIAAEEGTRAALEEAEERIAALAQELEAEGMPVNTACLGAAVKIVREAGDIGARLIAAEKDVETEAKKIEKLLGTIRPMPNGEVDIAVLPVPQKETVVRHRDRCREVERQLRTCRDKIRDAKLILGRHRKQYERTVGDEHVISAEELLRLRHMRDTGWSIIRRKYVEGTAVSDTEVSAFGAGGSLPDAYEKTIESADAAADLRFDRVEAAARLAEIGRLISEQQELLEELEAQERAHREDEAELTEEWTVLWQDIAITPSTPDEMLIWIDTTSEVLQSIERKTEAELQVTSLRDEEARAISLLTREIKALDVEVDALATKPLRVVLEMATDIQRQSEGKAENRRKIEEAIRKATTESGRKRKALGEAQKLLHEWRGQWSETVNRLGLDPEAPMETLDAQVDALDGMREVALKIHNLRVERIEKIERDIAGFKSEIAEVLSSVAPQLKDIDEDQAALELDRLLNEATRARESTEQIDLKIAGVLKEIKKFETERQQADQTIEGLQREAGASSVDELHGAIQVSDELRTLRTALVALTQTIEQDGDGLPLEELTAECEGIDLDLIVAREETINRELTDLRTRLVEAGETRNTARREFDAIGGGDLAARAAADRQSALSEMKDIAEEYIRIRSTGMLLQWAIDRYRREKQAPLLKRAGVLFATLTGGSFKELGLEFDEHDSVHLAGIRDGGGSVRVSGMSTGSADQLYLALRVAAVEEFLDHSVPLPFIADDLFINFDDERAAAGFSVLGQLAQRTQVLFFTHHRHLLDIGNAVLGKQASVVYL